MPNDNFLVGLTCLAARAQNDVSDTASLKGISAVFVWVSDLPDAAKVPGLTKEAIQTDIELKLRLAGMRVVTPEEGTKLPGRPYLRVGLFGINQRNLGAYMALTQNALLERNGELLKGVDTWSRILLFVNPTSQDIRNGVKDYVDQFLNDWLSVNPKQ